MSILVTSTMKKMHVMKWKQFTSLSRNKRSEELILIRKKALINQNHGTGHMMSMVELWSAEKCIFKSSSPDHKEKVERQNATERIRVAMEEEKPLLRNEK